MTEEEKEAIRVRLRLKWDSISPEERSRMATERNLTTWVRYTPDQRAERGDKISIGQAKARNAALAGRKDA